MSYLIDTDEFIRRARDVHGDEYDYSKTVYKNIGTKIIFTCPKHGDQEVWPQNHLRGCKCKKCTGKDKTTEEFIEECKAIHGDKYDYSKVEYKGCKTKVCVICHEIDPRTGKEHGEFFVTPSNHLKGRGCPKCKLQRAHDKYASNKEEFIERARKIHGDKYDYSLVEYYNAKTKVKIICHEINPLTGKEHGVFEQTPADHLSGYGCPNCAPNKKMNTEDFIIKAKTVHGDRYEYSQVNYVNNTTEVIIICKRHGPFKQLPAVHLRGCGCPDCVDSSYLENVIRKELRMYHPDIKFVEKARFDWLRRNKPMHLDFYLPDLNIAIECQGQQHFKDNGDWSNLEDNIDRDRLKKKLCEEHGIKIYYYSELGWDYPYFVYEDKKLLFEDIRNNIIRTE